MLQLYMRIDPYQRFAFAILRLFADETDYREWFEEKEC